MPVAFPSPIPIMPKSFTISNLVHPFPLWPKLNTSCQLVAKTAVVALTPHRSPILILIYYDLSLFSRCFTIYEKCHRHCQKIGKIFTDTIKSTEVDNVSILLLLLSTKMIKVA